MAEAMTALLSTLGSVITALITHVGEVSEMVLDYPIFALFLGVWFLGAAIGIFQRVINVR